MIPQPTRAETQAALDRKKALQAENDTHLINARVDVATWLDMTIRALYREKAFLEERGDVADGEIAEPWKLLQESIGRLRWVQASGVAIMLDIGDLSADLADDELWKEQA